MRLAPIFALALTACSSAAANVAEPVAIAAGVGWRDANGIVVPVARGVTADLSYFDATGLVWKIDPETAEVTPAVAAPDFYVYFESSDCTGQPQVNAGSPGTLTLPRVTFAAGGSTYVRLPGAAVDMTVTSTRQLPSGPCSVVGPGNASVFLTAQVSAPLVTIAGPLTPEFGVQASP